MKQFKWALVLVGSLLLPSFAGAQDLVHNPNDPTLQTNECDLNGGSSSTTCFQHVTVGIEGSPSSATITTASGTGTNPATGKPMETTTTQVYTGDYYYYLNANPSIEGPGVMQGARSNAGIAAGALDVWGQCRYIDNYGSKSYFVPFRTGGSASITGSIAPYEWTIFYTNTAPSPGVDGGPAEGRSDVDTGGDSDSYANGTAAYTGNFKDTPIITYTCAKPETYSVDPTGGNSLCHALGPYHINLPYARTGSNVSFTYNDTCNPQCFTNPTTNDTQCNPGQWTETTTATYVALNADIDSPTWSSSVNYSPPPAAPCNPNVGGQDGHGNTMTNGQCQGTCGSGTQTYYYTDSCGGTGPVLGTQPCALEACPPPPTPPPPPGGGDGGGGGGDGFDDDDDDGDDDGDGSDGDDGDE